MDYRVTVFGIAVLLLLLQGAAAQAQGEGALAGVESALGGMNLESLVPGAIGGIAGGPIVAVIVSCISSICMQPLILGAIGCLFCFIPGPICCAYGFIIGLMSLPLTLCQTLLCGYCPCNWPTYGIAGAIYSICGEIAGKPLADMLMGSLG